MPKAIAKAMIAIASSNVTTASKIVTKESFALYSLMIVIVAAGAVADEIAPSTRAIRK